MPGPRPTLRPLRRRTLWLGFAAVLVPLAVLLALQYRWLVELEHASEASRRAVLSNYLEAVDSEVGLFYTSIGERVLNVSADVFVQDRLDKAAGSRSLATNRRRHSG